MTARPPQVVSTDGPVLGAVLVALPATYVIWNPWGLIGRHEIRLLVGLVALALALRLVVRRRVIRVPKQWPLLSGFLLVVGASALFAGDYRTTIIGHADRHLGLVGWIALGAAVLVGVNADRSARNRFRVAVEACAVAVAVLGLVQVAGWAVTGELGPGNRITSTFGSATYTGAVLATAFPLLLDRAIADDDRRRRVLALIGALVVGLALLLTGSRGAWLGGLVGVALVLWRHRHLHRVVVLRVVAASAGVVGIALAVSSASRDRVESLFQPSTGTAGGRLVLWESGLRTVWDRPLLGWGPDRTRAALPPHLPRLFESEYWDQTVPDRAHNALVDVAVTSGVIAAVLMAALVVSALRTAPAESDESFGDVGIWRIVLIAHLPHLFFNFVQLDVDLVMAVVLGFLLAPAAIDLEMPVAARAVTSTVATAAAMIALVFGAGLVVADTVAARGVHAEQRGDALQAKAAYEQASTWSFGDARYHELLARFHRRQGDRAAAIESADRAAAVHDEDPFYDELAAMTRAEAAATEPALAEDALDRYADLVERWPNHGAYFTGIGVAFANTGRTEQAAESFRVAMELTPLSPEPYQNLARLLVSTGDTDQARAVLEEGIRRSVAPEQLQPLLSSLP